MTTKQLNQQQICWTKQLINIKFKIHYKKNSENNNADALSWWLNYERVKIIYKEILRENNEKILTKDLVTTHHMKDVSQNDNNVIRECHETRVSEHLKVRKIKDFVQQKHNLQNCCKRVQQYIAKCNFCQQNKINHSRQYNKVTQLNALNTLWILITINFIIKLSSSKNSAWNVTFNNILMIIDWLTKYIMFMFFKKTTTTSILTYIILQELISNHRLLKEFIINKDKLFTSKFWKMLTTKLRIKHKLLTAYYLQMNEQSE